jgi:methionyl-tRNA formyltransferase
LYDSIRAVAAAGHRIVLIGTCRAAPEYDVREADFAALAAEIGCPFFCDHRIDQPEYRALLAGCHADVAISVNWLTLVPREVLALFPYGVINAHAGDLPRYRGNAAPNWAMLHGEQSVVLTLHRMVEELDAGPILARRTMVLGPDTYIGEVYRFIAEHLPELFVEVLERLARGMAAECPQLDDPAAVLRCLPRLPRDSEIDWRQPAEMIARLVRASAEPFSGAYTFLDGEKLIVWRARPGQLSYRCIGVPGQVVERRPASGEVLVLTGDGVVHLEEVETTLHGRRPAAVVVRSTRARLGLDVAIELGKLKDRIRELEELVQRLSAR